MESMNIKNLIYHISKFTMQMTDILSPQKFKAFKLLSDPCIIKGAAKILR